MTTDDRTTPSDNDSSLPGPAGILAGPGGSRTNPTAVHRRSDGGHPDDHYQVEGAGPDHGVPARVRPSADPIVECICVETRNADGYVVQDGADQEAFIVAVGDACVPLDECA